MAEFIITHKGDAIYCTTAAETVAQVGQLRLDGACGSEIEVTMTVASGSHDLPSLLRRLEALEKE